MAPCDRAGSGAGGAATGGGRQPPLGDTEAGGSRSRRALPFPLLPPPLGRAGVAPPPTGPGRSGAGSAAGSVRGLPAAARPPPTGTAPAAPGERVLESTLPGVSSFSPGRPKAESVREQSAKKLPEEWNGPSFFYTSVAKVRTGAVLQSGLGCISQFICVLFRGYEVGSQEDVHIVKMFPCLLLDFWQSAWPEPLLFQHFSLDQEWCCDLSVFWYTPQRGLRAHEPVFFRMRWRNPYARSTEDTLTHQTRIICYNS